MMKSKRIIVTIVLILVLSISFTNLVLNYEKKITSLDRTILQYENQIADLSLHLEKSEMQLNQLKNDLLPNNLSYFWNDIWNEIYLSSDQISESQIEDINFLFQPTYNYEQSYVVNPLNGFFASYYDDIKDIDLGAFLRYSPLGIVPEELPEIKTLSEHPNWPFDGEDNLSNLPVPIHKFKRDLVQNFFSAYTGINLDELSETNFHLLIYLDSTDAYYNYTSDFGPASFRCASIFVEGNTIRLYGQRKVDPVLTIVKENNHYYIQSYNVN